MDRLSTVFYGFSPFLPFLKNSREDESHAGGDFWNSFGAGSLADVRGSADFFRAATVRKRKPAKGQSVDCSQSGENTAKSLYFSSGGEGF